MAVVVEAYGDGQVESVRIDNGSRWETDGGELHVFGSAVHGPNTGKRVATFAARSWRSVALEETGD